MRLQEGRSEYMESEGGQTDPMEYDSLLPPRKRLLAGLKRQNCDCSPPLPFISGELGAHFHGVLTSSDLSPEEIVEASRATALAATKAATAARVAATEKAVAAVKAKAFARSVLELVAYASVVGDENCRKSHPRRKKKIKKKHVPVELLYKAKSPVRCSETDEELARKLHRAMNSSPRISRRLNKALGSTKKDEKGTICDGNSASLGNDYVEQRDGNSQEKLGVRVIMCSRVESPGKMVEASELSGNIQWLGKGVGHGRRGRSKQKRLSLSQCCMRARKDFGKMQRSESYYPLTGESKFDTTREMPISTGKRSDEEQVPLEGKSSWKCKKFKISQCHYEVLAWSPTFSVVIEERRILHGSTSSAQHPAKAAGYTAHAHAREERFGCSRRPCVSSLHRRDVHLIRRHHSTSAIQNAAPCPASYGSCY